MSYRRAHGLRCRSVAQASNDLSGVAQGLTDWCATLAGRGRFANEYGEHPVWKDVLCCQGACRGFWNGLAT